MFCERVGVVTENARGAMTPRWEWGEDGSGLVADMTMTHIIKGDMHHLDKGFCVESWLETFRAPTVKFKEAQAWVDHATRILCH